MVNYDKWRDFDVDDDEVEDNLDINNVEKDKVPSGRIIETKVIETELEDLLSIKDEADRRFANSGGRKNDLLSSRDAYYAIVKRLENIGLTKIKIDFPLTVPLFSRSLLNVMSINALLDLWSDVENNFQIFISNMDIKSSSNEEQLRLYYFYCQALFARDDPMKLSEYVKKMKDILSQCDQQISIEHQQEYNGLFEKFERLISLKFPIMTQKEILEFSSNGWLLLEKGDTESALEYFRSLMIGSKTQILQPINYYRIRSQILEGMARCHVIEGNTSLVRIWYPVHLATYLFINLTVCSWR